MLKQKICYMKSLVAIFVTLGALICYKPAEAAGLVWQNVRPTVATRGMATNGSVFVSAAANGVFTSTDLKGWTRVNLPANVGQSYNDVIWSSAGSEFVAVGLGTILTSPDGANWTARYVDTADLDVSLQSVIYDNGTYVAVGTDNQGAVALVSTDGKSWQLDTVAVNPSGISLEFTGVAWGNGQYIAFGSSIGTQTTSNPLGGPSSDILYTSSDATHWSAQSLPQNGRAGFDGLTGNDAAFSAGVFVVGGFTGVYTSSDGVNWTASSLTPPSGNVGWYFSRILTMNGKFYAVGVDIGDPNFTGKELAFFSSSDGVNWSLTALNQIAGADFMRSADAFSTGGPGYIVAGDSGVWTSADTSTWAFYGNAVTPFIATCALFDHGVTTVTGGNYSVNSNDGVHWSVSSYSGVNTFTLGGQGCMAANGTRFLAATGLGLPIISSDGLSWSLVNDGIAVQHSVQGVAYDGTQFYMIGLDSKGNPVESSSSDGSNWNAVIPTGLPSDAFFGALGFVAGLTAGGGKLIAWGQHVNTGQPFLVTSGNGTQWTTVSGLPAVLAKIAAVGYGNGTYVAVSADANGNTILLTSADALNWTQIGNLPAGLKGVAWGNISYGGNAWLVTGVGGNAPGMLVVLTSPDGQSWSLQSLGVGDAGIAASGTWNGSGFIIATPYDILEAPVSTGGSPPPPPPPPGGGGNSGGGSGGGGLGMLAFIFLFLCAVRRCFTNKLAS